MPRDGVTVFIPVAQRDEEGNLVLGPNNEIYDQNGDIMGAYRAVREHQWTRRERLEHLARVPVVVGGIGLGVSLRIVGLLFRPADWLADKVLDRVLPDIEPD